MDKNVMTLPPKKPEEEEILKQIGLKLLRNIHLILPIVIIAIAVLLVAAIFKKPVPDVLKYEGFDTAVGYDCKIAFKYTVDAGKREATYDNTIIRWAGLTTNISYPLFLKIKPTTFGYYVTILRCTDHTFPIKCVLEAPEGDKEEVILPVPKGAWIYRYTGSNPHGIFVTCFPLV